MARSNNKEYFGIPCALAWEVFVMELNQVVTKHKALLHSFVLMDNHYHMMISTHENYNLGLVMCEFQRSVSRRINQLSGRINHVFGGRYRASIILEPENYFNVYKYIYRNPVEADLCKKVEDYKYSSLLAEGLPLSCPTTGISCLVPADSKIAWLNQCEESKIFESIRLGLKKTQFKPVMNRKY